MGRVRKPRTEGEPLVVAAEDIVAIEKIGLADPVPGDNGLALQRLVEFFKLGFPEDWETLRLCPLTHGLDTMIEKLKA